MSNPGWIRFGYAVASVSSVRVSLTTSVVAATQGTSVSGSSTGASAFKDALQSADHLPAPVSVSFSRGKSDVESKQKKKDEPSKPDIAGQVGSNVELINPVQPKPVTVLQTQQSTDVAAESSSVESSVTGAQAASALSTVVQSNSLNLASILGDEGSQQLPPLHQAVSMATDAGARVQEESGKVDPSKNGKEAQVVSTDAEPSLISSRQCLPGLALSQDLLSVGNSKAIQSIADGTPASGTNKKAEDADKPQAPPSKTPLNTFPDTPPTDLPIATAMQTAVQTVIPAPISADRLDLGSTIANKPLVQIEGAGASDHKGLGGDVAKTRRKSDGEAMQNGPVAGTSTPDVPATDRVAAPAARLEQAPEQIQAGQAAAGPVPQDHARIVNSTPDSGASPASASQAASNVQVPEAAPMQALSGAHLVQSIHQSEMKLGLNSAEFGSISINTSVTHQMLSAQISLDHPELSRILSAHMPAVEEKLGQAYGLQTRVEVRDGSSAQSGARQQDEGSHSASSRRETQFRQSGVSRAISALGGASATGDVTRLDVRV